MNLLRSTPTTQTQTQYAAPPSALSQAAGLGTSAVAGYKLATMAGGGIAKAKKFDVGGEVEHDLYDLPTERLAEEVKNTTSQKIKQMGTAILRERALGTEPPPQGFAPGGIVAFAGGGDLEDDDEDYEEAKRLVGNPMGEFEMPKLIAKSPSTTSMGQETPSTTYSGKVSPASSTGKAFYNEILSSARNYAEKMGAKNPDAVAHVIATQAAAESGWGKSLSGQNNIFGIKGKGTVRSTLEDFGQGKVRVNQEFKDYDSIADATKDAVNLMATSPRYAKVWNARDPIEGLNAQSTSGYATAKDYGQLLHGVYKTANKAEGGEIKHFDGKDGSEVKELYPGEKSDKAMYAGIGDFLINAPKKVFENINPITGIYNSGKDFLKFANESPEEQFKKNYPELYAKKQQEKLEVEGKERRKKLGGMSDEEYAKYKAMSPNEMVQGKRPPFEENFPSNSIVKPVVPEKINNQGIASVVKNQAPASQFGPSKDLMGSEQTSEQTSDQASGKMSSRDLIQSYLMDKWNKQGEEAQQDKWMSILSAGLGMMGGTSPYAAANIGQGAQAGIAAHMAAKRNQQEQQKALLSGMSALDKQRFMEDYYKSEAGYKKGILGVQEDKNNIIQQRNAGLLEIQEGRLNNDRERIAQGQAKIDQAQAKIDLLTAKTDDYFKSANAVDNLVKNYNAFKNGKDYQAAANIVKNYGMIKKRTPEMEKTYQDALGTINKAENEFKASKEQAIKAHLGVVDELKKHGKEFTPRYNLESSSGSSKNETVKFDSLK
jgi:flagellum-specific peptidoglycan hydrolase FlgJ